jgi:hypothetical protein
MSSGQSHAALTFINDREPFVQFELKMRAAAPGWSSMLPHAAL